MVARTVDVRDADGYWNTVRDAAAVLEQGGLVVFPTETVYGIAACADRPKAMHRLRKTKQRSHKKPFTLHIPTRSIAQAYVVNPGTIAERIMRKGWPGPITLVLSTANPDDTPAAAQLDSATLNELYHENTIGLRCPDEPIALDLLREVKGPVVVASANRAQGTPARTAGDAKDELNGDVDLILDGGPARYNKASTIVRVQGDDYELLREGVFDRRMIDEMLNVTFLFVCTGNTCRSPMARGIAAGVLADRLGVSPAELGNHRVQVQCAGAFAGAGRPASDHAVEVMASRGIDISAHQSEPLTVGMIHRADHIFVMTGGHRETVIDMVPSAADRTETLLPNQDVTDPIGGNLDAYNRCADIIEEAVKQRLTEVQL